jgi:hypothetical protein
MAKAKEKEEIKCEFCGGKATSYLETKKGKRVHSCDGQECKKAAMLKQFQMDM